MKFTVDRTACEIPVDTEVMAAKVTPRTARARRTSAAERLSFTIDSPRRNITIPKKNAKLFL